MDAFADAKGTVQYRKRVGSSAHSSHFRRLGDLTVSSIGLGTYLGHSDQATDQLYRKAILRAVELGCNVIDTAINYRCQRSERVVGQAVSALAQEGTIQRSELVIATKGGFLPYDGSPPDDPWASIEERFITPGVITRDEIVAGCHCLSPRYLQNQLDQSLRNLGLHGIDIYYLHNAEIQLGTCTRAEFNQRILKAFEVLEANVQSGRIRMYGISTWDGFRCAAADSGHLSLEQMVAIAQEVAGADHHFKVIQLPCNLNLRESCTKKNQTVEKERVNILDAAASLGVYVMASATLHQRHLTRNLPREVREALGNLETDAQCAIQFVRSTPGLGTALVGMKQLEHVEQNLKVARSAILAPERVRKFIRRS